MKFKADKGTETYNKLYAIYLEAIECKKKALELVKTIGATKYVSSIRGVAGGIGGVEFKTKPDGWRKAGHKWYSDVYFPKSIKANKELLDKISALPVVSGKSLNEAVGYNSCFGGETIGVQYKADYFLFNLPRVTMFGEEMTTPYTPPADVVELTYSEFERLKAVPEPVSE